MIPFGEVVTISATQVEIPHTGKLYLPLKLNPNCITIDSFKTDTEIGALNGTSDRDLKVGNGGIILVCLVSFSVCSRLLTLTMSRIIFQRLMRFIHTIPCSVYTCVHFCIICACVYAISHTYVR